MKLDKAEQHIQSLIDINKGLGFNLSLEEIKQPKKFTLLGKKVGFLVVIKTAIMIEKSLKITLDELIIKMNKSTGLSITEKTTIISSMVEIYLEEKNGGQAVEGTHERFEEILYWRLGESKRFLLLSLFHFIYCLVKSNDFNYPSPFLHRVMGEGDEKKKNYGYIHK